MYLHLCHSSPDIDFSLHLNVTKRLFPEPMLSKRLPASSDRALCRTMGEYAVYTRLTHFVVALRVHQELHVRFEVTWRLAHRTDVYLKIVLAAVAYNSSFGLTFRILFDSRSCRRDIALNELGHGWYLFMVQSS